MSTTLGKNIKAFRKNKGFTQEELADLLNITPQAVSKWEKCGLHFVRYGQFQKLDGTCKMRSMEYEGEF